MLQIHCLIFNWETSYTVINSKHAFLLSLPSRCKGLLTYLPSVTPFLSKIMHSLILVLWEPFHNLITHSVKSTIFVFKTAVQSFNWLPLVPVLLETVNNHFSFIFYAPSTVPLISIVSILSHLFPEPSSSLSSPSLYRNYSI